MSLHPTSDHESCSLSWNLKKVETILKQYDQLPKEEQREFRDFLRHCSISGEIFNVLITHPSLENFCVIISRNPTLTNSQLSSLFGSIEGKEGLCKGTILLEDLVKDRDLSALQILQVAGIAKNKARATSLPKIFALLMDQQSYSNDIHKDIFLKDKYIDSMTDTNLLQKIASYGEKQISPQ